MPKRIVFLFLLSSFMYAAKATKVYSVISDDWDNPFTWSGGQVPANPDTIEIRHYVTFTHNLTIAAPSVLLVDSFATLCGDHQLDVACGSRFYNYGSIYVNSAIIRDGRNYGKFYSKNTVTIGGCTQPGFGQGYYNSPPGSTYVWPPVLCRTTGTGWQGVEEFLLETGLTVGPNPLNGGPLTVSANKEIDIRLYDALGRELLKRERVIVVQIDLAAQGIYLLEAECEGRKIVRKLVN